MSTTSSKDADLGALERKSPSTPPPRRRLITWLLPLGVLLAFAAIFASSLGDLLLGSVDVTVIRPRPSTGRASTGRVAFQAAGWVEPDPFPLHVVPLTSGVLEEVLVQESDRVTAGQVVARLVAEDAELELEVSEAALAAAAAAMERARIDFDSSTREFEEAIELTERVAVAQAAVAGRASESALYAQAAESARAEVQVATEEWEIQKLLKEEGAAGPRQVELAAARLASARATLNQAHARAAMARAERDAATARLSAALRDQQLRIEDRRRVEVARRELERSTAARRQAAATLELARLRRQRVDVRSPWDGVVLERLALPGSHVGGAGVAVCSLYDQNNLRVRVDVPFEEIDGAAVGQRAEILCEARPREPYAGRVLRRVQKADIQKVTLEVQVRFDEPDGLVGPDMLCQVRFLADEPSASDSAPDVRVVLIPPRLLKNGNQVWVLDPSESRARLREVQVGATGGEFVEILSGLNLTDKLIDQGRDQMEDGQPVRIVGGP